MGGFGSINSDANVRAGAVVVREGAVAGKGIEQGGVLTQVRGIEAGGVCGIEKGGVQINVGDLSSTLLVSFVMVLLFAAYSVHTLAYAPADSILATALTTFHPTSTCTMILILTALLMKMMKMQAEMVKVQGQIAFKRKATAKPELFVHKLSERTTSATVNQHFREYGAVSVRMAACKCWVVFNTQGGAEAAMGQAPHTIDGKEVKCQIALKKDGDTPETRVVSSPKPGGPKADLHFELFVHKLSEVTTENSINKYFRSYGGRGCRMGSRKCWVKFDTAKACQKVLDQPHHTIDGATVKYEMAGAR